MISSSGGEGTIRTQIPKKAYRLSSEGIHFPLIEVIHHEEEYDQAGFDILFKMQDEHFWYHGRHRYVFKAFQKEAASRTGARNPLASVVDLGGGCGGWIKYLRNSCPHGLRELALADSSLRALRLAQASLGAEVTYYQVDIMDLRWRERWDAAFMLDVIEHLPNDAGALRQVQAALRPGGLLFVTTPALPFFWSYYDVLSKHQRRYSHQIFKCLAEESGFRLLRSQYIMFSTSPALFLSRMVSPKLREMTRYEIRRHLAKMHKTPPAAVNMLLNGILITEETLSHIFPYPWGTSILGIFIKD